MRSSSQVPLSQNHDRLGMLTASGRSNIEQGCMKFPIPLWGGGELIKSIGEGYQVEKGEGNIKAAKKNIA